jgi:AcrR family transcriptional regulator
VAPPTKITRDMILRAGNALVRAGGIESVNARSLAAELGCSTQPIFSQFPTMEELKQCLHDQACEMFEQEVIDRPDPGSFLRSSYLKVVHLARDRSHVFRLVYLSEYSRGERFVEARLDFSSNRRILQELMRDHSLRDRECKDLLERISLLVHGVATLTATSTFRYDDNRIVELVESAIEDFVQGATKRRKRHG